MERIAVSPRPLREEDVDAVHRVSTAAFVDLGEQLRWRPPGPEVDEETRARRSAVRTRHLLRTDPGGCWVTEDEHGLTGVALAILRDGMWGLSLLAVHPRAQGSGVGSGLLRASLAYADGARAGVIMASSDPRALRAYARAGFDFTPTAGAAGTVDRAALPRVDGVRPGVDADLDLVDVVDARVRGASHRIDLRALLDANRRWWIAGGGPGDRGYVVASEASVDLLAATSPETAQRLLWTALAESPSGVAWVSGISAAQRWATEVVVRARIPFVPLLFGLFTRGDLGPMSPYLPSGPYL